jgi:hypothetical protein
MLIRRASSQAQLERVFLFNGRSRLRQGDIPWECWISVDAVCDFEQNVLTPLHYCLYWEVPMAWPKLLAKWIESGTASDSEVRERNQDRVCLERGPEHREQRALETRSWRDPSK